MIDREKIEQAVCLLLEGIGEDIQREGLLETPKRIAKMYEEICSGMDEDAGEHLGKTFTAEMRWFWKKILLFIPCASITCSRFSERFILLIYRMEG